jgi:cobalt-zinc-cadmium efflux system protein
VILLLANLALVAGLLVTGLVARSLSVFAEGADYLVDAVAIGLSLLAMRLGAPSATRPTGRPRLTNYAAAANGAWLLVLSLLLAAGAAYRLVTGTRQVHGLPVLVVSAVAAAVMLAGGLLLGAEAEKDDLGLRAILLDTFGDAAVATGVATTGAVIFATGGLYWLDPAVALVVSLVVAYQAFELLGQVSRALAS